MKKVKLFSENQIKHASIIELNADSKLLSKVIIDVQKLVLRPVLGDQLYNQVLDEVYQTVENTEHEMNPAIKTLLEDYIKDFLISAIVQDWIITNNYKMTNKGMVKLSDSNASPLSADEIEYAKNYYDQKVSAYKLNLINYLKSQKLIDASTDQDITSESVGWHLQSNDNYKPSIPYDGSLVPNPSGPVSWEDITDKPEEFNPAPHTHSYSSITDKPTEFNPSAHTHTYASITDKPASFTPSAHIHTINDVSNLQSTLNAKADLVGGFVPASQLPSYVDDVIEAINFAALPITGETGKMYVTVDNNKVYRWSGSTYIQIVASPGSTDQVPEGSVNKYFTDSRAIAALSSALSGKANTVHTHSVGEITDLSTYIGFDSRYFTENEVSTLISTKADASHTHSASDITTGTINSARLGSGPANSSTYLRGDGIWATITTPSGWGLSGNSGTSPGTNYIGTTDADLLIKSHATDAAKFIANRAIIGGNIGSNSNGGFAAVILGGQAITINAGSNYGFTLGGNLNTVTGNTSGTIGGQGSHAFGSYAYTLGSYLNTGGQDGTVMLGDSLNSVLTASATNALYGRFSGGYYLYNSAGSLAMQITSVGKLRLFNIPSYASEALGIAGESSNTVFKVGNQLFITP